MRIVSIVLDLLSRYSSSTYSYLHIHYIDIFLIDFQLFACMYVNEVSIYIFYISFLSLFLFLFLQLVQCHKIPSVVNTGSGITAQRLWNH